MNSSTNTKIHEALELLEESVKSKAVEIWEIIKEKYPNLKEKLSTEINRFQDKIDSTKEKTKDQANRVKEVSQEKIKDAATQVDESAHQHPWLYVGGIAVSSLLLGYILGRRS